MSRIHEALRKAAHENSDVSKPQARADVSSTFFEDAPPPSGTAIAERAEIDDLDPDGFTHVIRNAREISFDPPADSLLVHPSKPREAPAEEFRTLRTRLNHLQTLQSLRTLVITSPSPAEGKSFTAANLALTQAQLAGKRVLLADFDFRRPNINKAFQIDCSPGITDYLAGHATLRDIVQKVAGLNLYLMTAGESVSNPLELLNLRECKNLIDQARDHFDWVILDSPPLLSAADANLLASISDGVILVVRIGATTFDAVARAIPSISENNVLGVVVNGARRGELYNKYSYEYGYNSQKEGTETPTNAGTLYWL
jgi:receptor protein-tyrosine kinase